MPEPTPEVEVTKEIETAARALALHWAELERYTAKEKPEAYAERCWDLFVGEARAVLAAVLLTPSEIERLQAVNKALQEQIASVHTEYKYAWDEVVDLEERNGRMLAELAGRDELAR